MIKKVRDSNIEVLRILLMLVIVLHHYIVNSPVILAVSDSIACETIRGGGVQLYSSFAWLGR